MNYKLTGEHAECFSLFDEAELRGNWKQPARTDSEGNDDMTTQKTEGTDMKDNLITIDADTLLGLCTYIDGREPEPYDSSPFRMCANLLKEMGLFSCDEDVDEVNPFALAHFREQLAKLNPGRFEDSD